MPTDPRDYKLDIAGLTPPEPMKSPVPSRPWLSVYFACCSVYTRFYRHPDGDRYEGGCPRCGQRVRFIVGDSGTAARSFVVE